VRALVKMPDAEAGPPPLYPIDPATIRQRGAAVGTQAACSHQYLRGSRGRTPGAAVTRRERAHVGRHANVANIAGNGDRLSAGLDSTATFFLHGLLKWQAVGTSRGGGAVSV
jgi:hypothetical protein